MARTNELPPGATSQRVNQPNHGSLVLGRQHFHLLKSLPKPLLLYAAVAVRLCGPQSQQLIRGDPKSTRQGNDGRRGWKFGVRLVVGNHALSRPQGLGELYLSEAARLPEGEQVLAQCGVAGSFFAGMSRRILWSTWKHSSKTTVYGIYSVCIYLRHWARKTAKSGKST